MKIIRFETPTKQIQYGCQHDSGEVTLLEGDIFSQPRDTGTLAQVGKLLAPIEPRDIICIGLNYRKHAIEGNQPIPEFPVVFMKNSGSLQNPNDPIVLPRKLASNAVDYECEMAVIIGKPCYNVSKSDAMDYVLGYTCANDVSARDWQMKFGGSQWCRGKTFATFCPLGPCIVTADEVANPNNLAIRTDLNGQTMQDWNTNDMIFDVPTLIEFSQWQHKTCRWNRDTHRHSARCWWGSQATDLPATRRHSHGYDRENWRSYQSGSCRASLIRLRELCYTRLTLNN